MIDGLDANGLIVTFLMFAGVTVYGILRARDYPSPDQLTGWMKLHGLNPEAPSRGTIARYMSRTRWIRTVGFLIGWNVPFAWLLITRSAYRMNEAPTYAWLIGFALGIFVAELARPRPSGLASSLEPRTLNHYLPDFTRIDRWILTGLAILPVIGSELLPVAGPVFARNDLLWYGSLALTAIAIILATRILQELIVHRRQSFDDLDEMRADDAMRSTSIQGLAGLGYGGPLFLTATMAWDLVATSRGLTSTLIAVASVPVMVAAIGLLFGFPRMNTKWTVPRARTMA